jgi:broad specificity phosphatase PhoE
MTTNILVSHLKNSYALEKKYCGQIACSILSGQHIEIPMDVSYLSKKNVFTIYGSSLVRFRQTTGLLNEKKIGILEGHSKLDSQLNQNEIKEYWKDKYAKPEGGESLAEARKRLTLGMNEILERNVHIIVIITHQGILIYRYFGFNNLKKLSRAK